MASGKIYLHSWMHGVLIFGEYKSVKERRWLIEKWSERFDPMAYYFIIVPDVKEELNYKLPKKQKELPVMPDKKIPLIRPKSIYDNKSPMGIADEFKL